MKKLCVTLTKAETILGIIYLISQFLVVQPALVFINLSLPVPMTDAVLNFVFFSVNFFFTTLIFHRFLIENARIAMSNIISCIRSALAGFGWSWFANVILNIIIFSAFPDFFNVNDSLIDELARENLPLIAIGTVLLAPVAEELLYRGLIFRNLYNRSRVLAYTVTSVLFSLLHVIGYIGTYSPLQLSICFIQYLPASLILCWAYVRSGTIWSPILMHVFSNFLAIISMR